MSIEVSNVSENTRLVKFEDTEVQLNRVDPHGLWYFKWPSGETPIKLQSAFTSPGVAIDHLTNYVAAQPKRKAKE